jgi:hypothetical protein
MGTPMGWITYMDQGLGTCNTVRPNEDARRDKRSRSDIRQSATTQRKGHVNAIHTATGKAEHASRCLSMEVATRNPGPRP